ncbi:MAG: C69 family dipeptidase, partial [Candidatus Aminicenantes bacterium]|nr:C69 family dipeptidase [Candidatus Aminicenantes bacterium]
MKYANKKNLLFLARGLILVAGIFLLIGVTNPSSQKTADDLVFENCTSVFVGRLASADGSTMTSHSCDSGTDRTWITIVPHMKHAPGAMEKVYAESKRTKGPNDTDRIETGEIPFPAETYAFINAAYPIMNEYQLAIGETTIGGHGELKTDNGI